MNSNAYVSSDEEKCMNDILEKGINELKSTSNNVSNFNGTILKSSIVNRDETSSGISKELGLNFNYNKDDGISSNTTLGNNNVYTTNNARSSALRDLLNEIKNDKLYSKYASSDDEAEFRFKGDVNADYNSRVNTNNYNTVNTVHSPKNPTSNRTNTSYTNDLNFNDINYEIKHLQDKIVGLEKRLSNFDF